MNLLIHQDYGDHSRKAVIEFFTEPGGRMSASMASWGN